MRPYLDSGVVKFKGTRTQVINETTGELNPTPTPAL